MTDVIVLNGGSSSGKSGIARCLQAILPGAWITLGVDVLLAAMPSAGIGIDFAADGAVAVNAEFRAVESAWIAGIAAMARAGAHVIIDEVFLAGGESQRRWQSALDGLSVLWVGVHCDRTTVEAREIARGDRTPGMAAKQADIVHIGVLYDVEIETASTESMACARSIAEHVK